ncbi:MAG: hypothetical protein KatS3mg129_3260 [Leptospiraceae bacterium]|nr:MAG: hypothetical protein KatS3mg129_2655 [Leptospiraceae bacterium]GIX43527.1 MAG: hypothetical protein KatS3mg129_3260 [Leptospiraceae bacterium]
MKGIWLGLSELEWGYLERKVDGIGLDRYIFYLWGKWCIKILSNEWGVYRRGLYRFKEVRDIKRVLYKYRILEIEDVIYEILRVDSEYLGVSIGELLHYMIYCDMMGDGVGGECVLEVS